MVNTTNYQKVFNSSFSKPSGTHTFYQGVGGAHEPEIL